MADELRVLHAADLHIDSPLHGLVAYEGAPVDELRSATRRAMENLVATAIERQVHLVVIAGDLYDGDWRDYNTGLFVVARLAELHEAGIPVVLLYGNHDAASNLTKQLHLPPNTTSLSATRPSTKHFEELGVAVHGQSYATRAVLTDLVASYPQAEPNLVNIGLLHTCLSGSPGHEPYAPCSVDDLRAKGYDYWALGHIHRRWVVETDPLTVFPGNLQGRHAKETGPKGATLVTFTDGVPAEEPIVLDVVRWEHPEVDVSDTESIDECLERCQTDLSELVAAAGRTCALRVTLVGETGSNRTLRARPEWLRNEIRAIGLSMGGSPVWIERVAVETSDPSGGPGRESTGPLAEIASVLADLRADIGAVMEVDDPTLNLLRDLRKDLRAAAASEDEEILGSDELAQALEDAAELLSSRLTNSGPTDAD
jgi:DNA repair exonuclease SbcCD nuclease subunit